MATNLERLRGLKPEQGRRYDINPFGAIGAIVDIEDADPKYKTNIELDSFASYVETNTNDLKNDHYVDYDGISFEPKISKSGLKYGARFGVIRAKVNEMGIDLRDNSGTILVGTSDPVIEIQVMKVNFPQERPNVLITPGMVSKSLASLAEYLRPRFLRVPPMLMGLTHPRMGQLSRRWGFEVADNPFPPEVYSIIEDAREQVNFLYPDEFENLQKIGRQVVVYQPTTQFIDSHSRASK